MVVFSEKKQGCYPKVKVVKGTNLIDYKVIDDDVELSQNHDLYIYIDFSNLTEYEILNDAYIYLSFTQKLSNPGSIRLKAVGIYDHENENKYSSSDKGDITSSYLSVLLDEKKEVKFNITPIALKQFSNNNKKVNVRLKYYGEGKIVIKSIYKIVQGTIQTKQDLISSKELEANTKLLLNNTQKNLYLVKPYQFEYSNIVFQNNIVFKYNIDLTLITNSFISHKFQLDLIDEKKYLYTNDIGQRYIYYEKEDSDNGKIEYECIENDSKFSIDDGLYKLSINGCMYEINADNCNIQKISKGNKCLLFEYDDNQSLIKVYKGPNGGTKDTTLTEFISVNNTNIICTSNKKKIEIKRVGDSNIKIEEFDIDNQNNVSSKNNSLQIEGPQGSIDVITINEIARYDIFIDENDNLIITNLLNQLIYTLGFNQYNYYISDNYNNIEKYYYNTKNEVIYYVKEKNGKIFEKKCIGYRDNEIKEQINLMVDSVFDDLEFEEIYQRNQSLLGAQLTESVSTNENMFFGLCNKEYTFNQLSALSEREIRYYQLLEGNPGDIITVTMLSKVTLDGPDEFLNIELDVGYMTKNGVNYKTYCLNCRCKDNDYEFNSLKIIAEQVFISVTVKIKYKGVNECKISNIMIYKDRGSNKVIYDDEYKVIGVSQQDTTTLTDYADPLTSKISSIKSNDGRYMDYTYNNHSEIILEKNLGNQDYVEYEYTDDNLLIYKKSKNDIYETIETYEYDEFQNIAEETVDDKTNYYFNKTEQDKTIVQCINYNGLLNKYEETVNSLSDIKSIQTFQLNDCYEKNKFHYENGVLKQIDSFDDRVYIFNYDSKNRIKNIYIDNKLYMEYIYASVDFNAIEKKKYQNDNTISFTYDDYGRITDVYNIKSVSEEPKKIASYEYDNFNRITLIKNKDNIIDRKYKYDELGNIVECETPTHVSKYVYNNDKELVDIKIDERHGFKVFSSSTVSSSTTIENVFKELTKNMYCDYYFPNEKQETYGNTKLIADEHNSINGQKNIVYDESLKRNIMLCNGDIDFNIINMASNIKKESMIYNGKIFTELKYFNELLKKQGALGIFKFDSSYTKDRFLLKLSGSTNSDIYLYISKDDNNIKIRNYFKNDSPTMTYEDFSSGFYVNNVDWHIIGIINDTENNKIGIIFDDQIQWFDTEEEIYNLIEFNDYKTFYILGDSSIYKIAYLMYGCLNITQKRLQRIYKDFQKVFNENNIEFITSNTYDVFDREKLNKIPLNKSFLAYNDTSPWVIYSNDEFLNNSDKYFRFDNELNKYCYEASSYNESYLSYFIGDNLNNLLISAQVKLLNVDFDTENTIYCVKGNSEKVKITYKYPNINVYVNGTFKQSFNVDFKLDKFNYVKTYISNGVMTLTVNEETKVIDEISINNSSNCTLIIGNDDNNNCFEGLISDVIYGNTLNDVDTNILPTQFISKSDAQGRLRKKIIKTNQNKIETTYSYYDKIKYDNVKTLNHLINRVKNHDGSEEIISYDENDSIIKRVLIKNDLVVRINNYKYDSFNRLIEEVRYETDANSNILSETYKGIYEYDNYGNIIRNKTYRNSILNKNMKLNYQRDSPHTLMSYVNEYNNSKNNIQYGNSAYPTKIGNNSIIYEGSRIVSYGNNTYVYDTLGKRIQKNTEDNKVYNYSYDNDNLIKQTCNDIVIDYIYNNSLLEGLRYNNEEFYYIRDITGCIEKIIDKDNNVMVLYKYTSYGEVEKIVNNQLDETRIQIANILKEYNGFVYKGYYYDVETGWFWLSSRYYSPELCRFISPDDIEYLDPESVNGLNLYCYCLNNPIMYADPSGHVAISLLAGLIISGLVSWGLSELFGEHLVTGTGLAITGGSAVVSGIMAMTLATPVGWIVGGITAVAGICTLAFASAELQQHFTGDNWMLDGGMSEGVYYTLMTISSITASVGTTASSAAYHYKINAVTQKGRINGKMVSGTDIDGYPGLRFSSKTGKVYSLEFHPNHNGHGVHIQWNQWFTTYPKFPGEYVLNPLWRLRLW